jgi:hypothetical protein
MTPLRTLPGLLVAKVELTASFHKKSRSEKWVGSVGRDERCGKS